ncbi:hypothetical protein KEM48_000871 [Puccinia striiformis f. sp. tritici PST-130]|nr:hypothetical protein KEM48_000871 [Puccinia striiformis f. sp. tritici PST-130]
MPKASVTKPQKASFNPYDSKTTPLQLVEFIKMCASPEDEAGKCNLNTPLPVLQCLAERFANPAQKVVRWSDADGISNEGSHSQSGGNGNVDQNLNQAKFDHHKRCLVSPTGFLVTACASPGAMISFEPDGCLLSTQVDFDLPDYKPLDASALRNDKAARGKLKPTQRNSPFSPGPRADFHPFVEEQLSILEKISSQQPRHLEETLAMPVMQAMKILEERSVVVEDVKNQARSILERQDARGPQKFKSLAESVYLENSSRPVSSDDQRHSPLVDVHPHQLPPLKIQTASEMVECALTVENETVSQVKPDSALISFDSPAKVENVAQTEPDSLQEEIGVLDTSSANVQSRRDFQEAEIHLQTSINTSEH